MTIETGLKLKALLVSEDAGRSWLIVRQHYCTGLASGAFLDENFQGRRLALVNSTKDTKNEPDFSS